MNKRHLDVNNKIIGFLISKSERFTKDIDLFRVGLTFKRIKHNEYYLYLWGIGILNVILVLIIIVVAVRVAKQ